MQRTVENWQVLAACRGPHAELFFPPNTPERKEDKLNREADAKAICADCPVVGDCLDYAIDIREPHGIWGGLNEIERRQLVENRFGRRF
jgi:WhiB family transcriptional regulator, redox-sensing transcriptional regulator